MRPHVRPIVYLAGCYAQALIAGKTPFDQPGHDIPEEAARLAYETCIAIDKIIDEKTVEAVNAAKAAAEGVDVDF